MTLKQLFGTSNYIRPGIGDRVKNKETRQEGTVTGKSITKGEFKVFALNVQYDDGRIGSLIPENEFIKIGKAAR